MTKYVKLLLALNFGFFIVNILLQSQGLYLNNIMALYPTSSEYFHLYQLVSYMFAHAGFSHIIINMLILFVVGPKLEENLGSDNFLNLYMFSGIIAGLSHVLISGTPVLGASAAVWGIFASHAIMNPREKLYLWFVLPVQSIYLIGALFFYELISIFSSDGISHIGHVTGAISGVLFYFLLRKRI